MKPEWRTDTKPIDLSDEEPARFQAYCEWLYTKDIVAKASGNDLHLGHLYLLGAKLMDGTFQKKVLRAVVDNMYIVRLSTISTFGYNCRKVGLLLFHIYHQQIPIKQDDQSHLRGHYPRRSSTPSVS
jgi:hypothetical protein